MCAFGTSIHARSMLQISKTLLTSLNSNHIKLNIEIEGKN